MIARNLDSRASLGSDLERRASSRDEYVETSTYVGDCFAVRTIRVVLGRLGDMFRFSAQELDIVAEGDSIEEAWDAFLGAVGQRDDAAWLTFDVGPTRPHEVDDGLDASEDEDWAEPYGGTGVN